MTIVFLNRMEQEGEREVRAAQVWIEEEGGLWISGWNEDGAPESAAREIWYEGSAWNEMLAVYRHMLAAKLAEGYRPIIRDTFQEFLESGQRGRFTQKLVCYSELNANEELYKKLAAWRRVRATEEHRAPYLIATNRALRLISTFLPQTLEELRDLPGIGENTVQRYGELLLEQIAGAERAHAFPLDWVERRLDEEEFTAWTYKSKERKFKREAERVRAMRLLLEASKSGGSLSQIGQESGLERRDLVEMMESLEKDGYDLEPVIAHELQLMPERDREAVLSAYAEMGDSFLKPVLKKVYGEEPPSEPGLDILYEQLRMLRILHRRTQNAAQREAQPEASAGAPEIVVSPQTKKDAQARREVNAG
ncbi:HRDC domain-containing protein [Saccharibacillus sp. CPCC 101409]|uniref:HRDC domain-containing protein n=1 Tax=Saccharibacillus sp. CPCC 101409 TaxID=3058041 RepID=UPI002671F443|nr:HRDC domain-containing protein [Saccharibacillus sp. CPCC 101409]MDO3408777.1 HRDC domain-containing protein [Saccharibacillus sp. CPCC 101409]